jgi:hypothetical protein
MARAKIWLRSVEHIDNRRRLRRGQKVALPVAYYGGHLYVESWGGHTTIHGRLVGIEWHEMTIDLMDHQRGPV